MPTAIELPELGVGDEQVRVSCWLVDTGDAVTEGERVVEVLVRGMTFDIPAPVSGIVGRIERPSDSVTSTHDVLGWIEEASLEIGRITGVG